MNLRTKERKLNEKYGWNKQRLDCLDYLFNTIFKFERKKKQYSFTATDVDYDNDDWYKDGYDPHRHIEFKIKELPMWRFGIWLQDPEQYDNTKAGYKHFFRGTFFAQVEQFCDKFKPSRSGFVTEFMYNPKHTVEFNDGTSELVEEDISSDYEIQKTLVFMLEQPALAFCRDVCFWDYNIEYHTKAEAERKMNKIIEKDNKQRANEKIIADRVEAFAIDLVSNRSTYFKEYITDAVITKYDDMCSPSREIYLYYPEDGGKTDNGYMFIPKKDLTKEGYSYWTKWFRETRVLARKLKVCSSWEWSTVGLDQIVIHTGKKRFNYIKKNCC